MGLIEQVVESILDLFCDCQSMTSTGLRYSHYFENAEQRTSVTEVGESMDRMFEVESGQKCKKRIPFAAMGRRHHETA